MNARPLLLLLSLSACSTPPKDPNGTWTGTVTSPEGESHPLRLDIKIDGATVTGSVIGPPSVDPAPAIEKGTFSNGQFAFEVATVSPEGDSARFGFRGRIENGHMDGEITDAEGTTSRSRPARETRHLMLPATAAARAGKHMSNERRDRRPAAGTTKLPTRNQPRRQHSRPSTRTTSWASGSCRTATRTSTTSSWA